jgi:hypothetical protein
MTSTLNTYITSLLQVTQHSQPEPPPEPDTNTLRPLLDRVRDLLATIPDSVKAEGLVLRELQARLRGRQGRSCSHAELGACLRTLGYQRVRRWSDSQDGFVARWHVR